MLIFNLAGLSNAQIRERVWARCKRFGRVHEVSIHKGSTVHPGVFALVDMASVAEVKKVIKGIGDALFGTSALIYLSQDLPFADEGAVALSRVPHPPRAAAVEEQTVVRAWLDTSARYFREGAAVPAAA
jgi:hypothetical protein